MVSTMLALAKKNVIPVISYGNLWQNLQYTLSLNVPFASFLVDGSDKERKTKFYPFRGFLDDGDNVDATVRRTAQQKVSMLELMLGQIDDYCLGISRNTIMKNSTSIMRIWQVIHQHYGFYSTGLILLIYQTLWNTWMSWRPLSKNYGLCGGQSSHKGWWYFPMWSTCFWTQRDYYNLRELCCFDKVMLDSCQPPKTIQTTVQHRVTITYISMSNLRYRKPLIQNKLLSVQIQQPYLAGNSPWL